MLILICFFGGRLKKIYRYISTTVDPIQTLSHGLPCEYLHSNTVVEQMIVLNRFQCSEKSRPGPIYALNKTLNFLPFQSAWKRNTVIFFLFCDNGDFNRAHHNFKYTVLVSNGGQLCMNNERGQFNRLKSKKPYSNSTFIIYILDAVMCNYLIN